MEWLAEWSGQEVQEAWAQQLADLLAWGLLGALLLLFLLLVLFPSTVKRRRFWCHLNRREVEVEFEERGVPGWRQPVAVKSCSVFDPPTAVTCRRHCLDPAFRRQWPPALPIETSKQP